MHAGAAAAMTLGAHDTWMLVHAARGAGAAAVADATHAAASRRTRVVRTHVRIVHQPIRGARLWLATVAVASARHACLPLYLLRLFLWQPLGPGRSHNDRVDDGGLEMLVDVH